VPHRFYDTVDVINIPIGYISLTYFSQRLYSFFKNDINYFVIVYKEPLMMYSVLVVTRDI